MYKKGGAIRHLRAMKYSTIFPDSAAEPRAPRGRPPLVRIPSSSRWTRPPFPSIATLSRSHDLYKNPPGVRLSVCVRACGGDGCVFPKATVMCSSIDDGGGKEGGGGVAPCSLSDLSISSSHLSGYEFHGERRDRTRRHMCTHVQNASDGVVSDSLIGEQVGKNRQRAHGDISMQARSVETQALGRTGRVTGSSGLTDGWTDARCYPRCAQIRRLIARRARAAARPRPRPAQTDRRPFSPCTNSTSSPRLHLSGPQTGGDVCSLRHRQLLFLSAPSSLPPSPPSLCPPPLL